MEVYTLESKGFWSTLFSPAIIKGSDLTLGFTEHKVYAYDFNVASDEMNAIIDAKEFDIYKPPSEPVLLRVGSEAFRSLNMSLVCEGPVELCVSPAIPELKDENVVGDEEARRISRLLRQHQNDSVQFDGMVKVQLKIQTGAVFTIYARKITTAWPRFFFRGCRQIF